MSQTGAMPDFLPNVPRSPGSSIVRGDSGTPLSRATRWDVRPSAAVVKETAAVASDQRVNRRSNTRDALSELTLQHRSNSCVNNRGHHMHLRTLGGAQSSAFGGSG